MEGEKDGTADRDNIVAGTPEGQGSSGAGAPAAEPDATESDAALPATAATAAITHSVPPSKDDAAASEIDAEQEKGAWEDFEKSSEELRLLLQHKPPPMPDIALLEQHKQKHPECIQLLKHMETILAKRLYHEFTLASTAYLAPLMLLGGNSNAGGESRGGTSGQSSTSAGPLAAAAALPFAPFPSGYPNFEPFERLNFFHRITAPLQPNMDISAYLRLLAAICEDLEPVDALVFLSEHGLRTSVNTRPEQQQQLHQSSSRTARESGDSAGSAAGRATEGRGGGTGRGTAGSSRSSGGGTSATGAASSTSSLTAAAAALEAELLYESCRSYHLSRCDRLTESEEILEELKKRLAVTMGVSPIAQAAFHRAAATLAKAQDKHADFYHQAMMFLAYTPAASIPENERVGLAYEVAIAALVAPDIFNFGELLQQALVISSLRLPEHRWLYDLVEAFHCGSMAKYDETCSRFAQQIQSTALAAHVPALRRKISVAALLRLAFTHSAAGAATAAAEGGGGDTACSNSSMALPVNTQAISVNVERRPAAARSLSFQMVANTCKVGLDEVELLVMSAMSKQLLRGTIDQVNREVNISWVRPALLLDDSGMACLQERLLRWVAAAQNLHQHLHGQTAELLGS